MMLYEPAETVAYWHDPLMAPVEQRHTTPPFSAHTIPNHYSIQEENN
jgi:hypothetical protein